MKNISAFPTSQYSGGIAPSGHSEGMTLRDYFAAKAMQGMFAGWDFEAEGNSSFKPSVVAKRAYLVADEMLKARGGE